MGRRFSRIATGPAWAQVSVTPYRMFKAFPAEGVVWYQGAKSTIAGLPGGDLNYVGVGFTLGYKINDNLMLTAGYTATIDGGPGDLDLGVFRINLIYGWHQMLEGIDRLAGADAM